ncbi:response regulator transcription factor [Anaerocolumna sp. MB42-C2]|uniref:response regulator transcription factor n=1 Tax=Anaerocolumna sp. MB42-C2 TaxID=3070997 RepID=UPI0027DF578D|nr:response regulator [Anaerocolumna sp. MB42-C2]WMJ89980.1 response regulator [Anaerocolumna sp. MB42-C2]
MKNVMIVDDEIMVRLGMQSIIDWEEQGYQVVAEAENGQDALEKIEIYHPDLIFTDLVMDKMDGFRLIEECKEKYNNIQFVILSNHNDFNNVRKALQLGALDYVFKLTINKEEILKILGEVNQKLGKSSNNEMESVVRKNRQAIKSTLIKMLAEKTYIDRDEILRELNIVNVRFPFNKPYIVMMVGIDDFTRDVLTGKITSIQLTKFSMENMITEILEEQFNIVGFNYDAEDVLYLIETEGFDDQGKIYSELNQKFQIIFEYLKRYFDINVTGVISKIYNNIEGIHYAVNECKNALYQRLPGECGKLHFCDDNLRSEIRIIKEYINEHLNENLSIEIAAREINMSQSYFSHVFKDNMKMGFTDYVNRTRIMRACELLQNQNIKINEVALLVGIENYNYFSILFKKIIGIAPNVYRKNFIEKTEEIGESI